MMTSLAKRVAADPPDSFLEMLQLSQTVAPSFTLRTGGFLMELYILRYGKRGGSKFLSEQKTRIRPSMMEHLLRRYGFPFWFHIIA